METFTKLDVSDSLINPFENTTEVELYFHKLEPSGHHSFAVIPAGAKVQSKGTFQIYADLAILMNDHAECCEEEDFLSAFSEQLEKIHEELEAQ